MIFFSCFLLLLHNIKALDLGLSSLVRGAMEKQFLPPFVANGFPQS